MRGRLDAAAAAADILFIVTARDPACTRDRIAGARQVALGKRQPRRAPPSLDTQDHSRQRVMPVDRRIRNSH